jgi:hypothetical protein
VPGPLRPGLGRYEAPDELPPVHFALSGTWRVSGESATAVRDAEIHARVTARKVFLVMSSAGGRPRELELLLDGKPAGRVTVREERLYRLVALPDVQDRTLRLRVPAGVSAYAFTFG